MLRKTRCLIRVGVGKSADNQKSNPSFRAITKVSKILGVKAVLVMGIDRGIKKAQNNDSTL